MSALTQLKETLAVDGYGLAVEERGERRLVTVTSADDTCDDCLVPKIVMTSFLEAALDVPSDLIDLVYPGETRASADD